MSATQEMRELRQQLIDDKTIRYLGKVMISDVLSEYAWVRNGAGDVLTTSEDAKAYADARKAHNDDPDANAYPEQPNAALFSAVMKISRNSFYMQSCGLWQPGGQFNTPLHKQRLTAMGECPEHVVFFGDWSTVLAGLERIRNTKFTSGMQKQGPYYDTDRDGNCVKLRHVLFEVSISRRL